jgi:hypothetical protein
MESKGESTITVEYRKQTYSIPFSPGMTLEGLKAKLHAQGEGHGKHGWNCAGFCAFYGWIYNWNRD